MQSILFEPLHLGKLELKNHFVMSAAADNLSNAPAKQLQRFSNLANGNIGLIISGGTPIRPHEPWNQITKVIHAHNSKFAIQIVSNFGLHHGIGPSQINPDNLFFSSRLPYQEHHAATEEEIMAIIDGYAASALRAKNLGVDAIELHAAHHSLPSQFLSPLTNLRTDRWGGSLQNRIRIHIAIIKAIRANVGKDFPIIIKIGVEDGFDNGLKFSEGKIAAELIAACDIDALEISQGLMNFHAANKTPMRSGIVSIAQEGYFSNWCRAIKSTINKPTISSGGLRSFEFIEKLVIENTTDLVGLCRPLIREPHLIERWQNGDTRKATCISCNKCVTELLAKGKPLACFLDLKNNAS